METSSTKLPIAVVGAGVAGEAMIAAINRHPALELKAVCDPNKEAMAKYSQPNGPALLSSLEELTSLPDLQAVYLATPTPLHCSQAEKVSTMGLNIIVEKPMACSLKEADRMIQSAQSNAVHLIVGHSHSFEAPIRAMRDTIEEGRLGALRAINGWYFSDWMYRPRDQDEFDITLGGGVVFRQGSHHADVIRYLGGGKVRSLRASLGDWQSDRPGNGSYSAYLEFEDGTPATMFYSGYNHFSSEELTFNLGENGQITKKSSSTQSPRSESKSRRQELISQGIGPPCFGLMIVSCSQGDMRIVPDGIAIYSADGMTVVPLDKYDSGRIEVLNELVSAIRDGVKPSHDGCWGKANLEICAAMTESASKKREIYLDHQITLTNTISNPRNRTTSR